MVSEKYIYYKGRKEELLRTLKEFLEKEPDVVLATVFGSFVEDELYRDVDIAIYATREELGYYLTLGARLERAAKVPIDLVPLREVPPSLALKALRGMVLVEKLPGLYEALLSKAYEELSIP